MKKVVLVSDGKNFPAGAFEFAKLLQEAEPILLVGSFSTAINYAQLIPITFAMEAGPLMNFSEEYLEARKKSIALFEEHCQKSGIEYRVHEEGPEWNIDDLIKESRFADLFLMSEELFANEISEEQPNSFLQQVMHRAECPALVVPENFKSLSVILLAYDGKRQSMFAIKEFCNLFPQFKDVETKLVFMKQDDNEEIPDLSYIEEYAARHFSNLEIQKLHFDAKKYFNAWAEEKGNALIVSGSYSRSGFSNWVRKSFTDEVIHEHSQPVFVAHMN